MNPDSTAERVRSAADQLQPRLALVAWELTRSCNLFCSHCRASACHGPYPGELTTDDCFRLVDQIAEVGRPILILSGGEPLARRDVFQIGRYASHSGLRVVMGTNGTLITEEVAAAMKAVPLSRISVSLDFPQAGLQDAFRGRDGAFAQAVAGVRHAQRAGVDVQINSTITRMNVAHLPALVDLALELKAVAFHPFLLVPTGRGKALADQELSAQDYETTLSWICRRQTELGDTLVFKPTDAPHYQRIMRQNGVRPRSAGGHGHPHSLNATSRGCLAGVGFCFVSHVGTVQGCGYLDLEAGDLRKNSFAEIWSDSPLFRRLRDISNLKGKCGRCEFKRICGGCRARAYEATGDCLAAEPYCIHQPASAATPT